MSVQNLISYEGVWNESVVRMLVPKFEADAILDIPLNRRGGADVRYWKATENGQYSVKSGHHMERNSFAPPPSLSYQPIQNWWKLIW